MCKPFMYKITSSQNVMRNCTQLHVHERPTTIYCVCACVRRNKLYQVISFVHRCLVSIILFSLRCCSNSQSSTSHCTDKMGSIPNETFKMLNIFAGFLCAIIVASYEIFKGLSLPRLYRIFLAHTR